MRLTFKKSYRSPTQSLNSTESGWLSRALQHVTGLFLVMSIGASSLTAQETTEDETVQEEPRRLIGLSAGVIDFTRSKEALEVGADFQWKPVSFFKLRPHVGFGVTVDDTYFVFAGARRELPLGASPWLFDISFGVTYYERGDGKELGQELEFRSGLDFLRQLRGGSRIGIGVYHLSNAGLAELNPGTNSVVLRWVVPVG